MTELLKDGQGRVVEYLRVSVTDRCNLRCSYCMPPGGVELSKKCDILRYKDLLALLEIFAGLGVRKVRFTGGEPLVRKGIVDFIRQVRGIPGIEQIALTTNGVNLRRHAHGLKEAGVSRVNVSLDTLDRDRFEKITGFDSLETVLDGIEGALQAGIESVKINMVVIKDVNDGEIERFAELSRTFNAQVRFIEFMPATPDVWDQSRMIPMTEVKRRIEAMGALTPCEPGQWGGPARIFRFDGAVGEIGFISSVSRHFCHNCNRLRLTSTGELLTCLFADSAINLKTMLDGGASAAEIENAILGALKNKNAVRDMSLTPRDRARATMSSLGG